MTEVFWEMPLRVVFAYEHLYYRKEGIDTVSARERKKTLDALLS